MAIVLNVNDLLDAATDLVNEGLMSSEELAPMVAALEAEASRLADALARIEGVTHSGPADYQAGFAGLCATFYRGPGDKESEVLESYDTGGEWDDAA